MIQIKAGRHGRRYGGSSRDLRQKLRIVGMVRTKFVSRMTNPIQQVLQAERVAQQELETARQHVETAIAEARQRAQAILARNDARTQDAIGRFEAHHTALLKAEADALKHTAEMELAADQTRLDEHFTKIIDETFADFWPLTKATTTPG